MTAFAHINGETVIDVDLHVPNNGPWWADLILESNPDINGRVTLVVGDLTLIGTVTQNGTFGLQRKCRVVGGGAGWGTVIAKQHYHNDANINAIRVAQDAARLAGEQIGSFNPGNQVIGVDYVRESGLASRVLEDVIGGVTWHVGYDGITNVGNRTTNTPDTSLYDVLEFDPRNKIAIITSDSLSSISVGSIITNRLDVQETVYEMEIRVTADMVRTIAWCGGSLSKRGRLVQSITQLVEAVVDKKLFGKYRYRVVNTNVDGRLQLQAVSMAANLPDMMPILMKPGASGLHSKPALGSIVLVEFIEGDRTMPIVTAYASKSEEGFLPTEAEYSVSSILRLGSDTASQGVLLGDSFKSWADAHKHGYLSGPLGNPALTTPPALTPDGITPDPSPSPSAKVKVSP